MSTFAEIEAALEKLPVEEQERLLSTLALRLENVRSVRTSLRRLKSAELPAIEGLPADLSVGTRDKARALVATRHGGNR